MSKPGRVGAAVGIEIWRSPVWTSRRAAWHPAKRLGVSLIWALMLKLPAGTWSNDAKRKAQAENLRGTTVSKRCPGADKLVVAMRLS